MAPLKQVMANAKAAGGVEFSMPLKHGPIEALSSRTSQGRIVWFSMPLKHGPIEALTAGTCIPFTNRFPCP